VEVWPDILAWTRNLSSSVISTFGQRCEGVCSALWPDVKCASWKRVTVKTQDCTHRYPFQADRGTQSASNLS